MGRLGGGPLSFCFLFQPLHTFGSQYRETAILASLGRSEKDHPEHAFHFGADGQGHLGEREDVEGYATEQYDYTCLER